MSFNLETLQGCNCELEHPHPYLIPMYLKSAIEEAGIKIDENGYFNGPAGRCLLFEFKKLPTNQNIR